MILPMALPAFDPDFASPSDWAAMYRAVGLQVVPARYPMRDRTDKRPALANWREFQNDLAPQAVFDRWYGPEGEHRKTPNMGVVSGAASANVIVIDLDEHSKTDATWWWRGLLELHNHGGELETWCQATGGGGRQLFFRAPATWHAPTNRTPIGVDVRGQGGFAMLPPSVHLSGKEYTWFDGMSPWEIPITDAPSWLLEAVDDLVLQFGGDTRGLTQVAERTESPAIDFDAFGARVDGREDAMTRAVWGAVVGLHRETAGVASEDVAKAHYERALADWLRKAKTRLIGVDNATGLERECRGATMFLQKWQRAMKRWDGKVAADARAERPTTGNSPVVAADVLAGTTSADRPRFPFEKVGDLRCLPETRWLVDKWIPERSSGIFYGKWAAGKSFIGFDLALHLSYGMTDWHGADLPGEPVHVLILAREGHSGFVGRVDAFKTHYGIIDDPPHLTFMRASVSFMKDDDFAALCDAVRARGEPYRLVLIDTVARVLPGVDMNEQQTVTMFTERCQALAEVTGAAAIGVHHQNKAGSMMGSTYFEANSDFVFEVTRLGEDDGPLTAGEITCTKQKDGEDKWKRSVRYAKVSTSRIDPDRASLVVEKIGEEANAEPRKGEAWPDRDVCDRILAAIREAWSQKQPWSNAPQARRDGRYAVERIARQFGIPASLAENIVQTWLLNDVLAVEVVDKNTKARGLKVIGVIR